MRHFLWHVAMAWVGVAVWSGALAGDAAAQRFRAPQQQQAAQQIVLDRVQVSGTIAEIGPNWLRVTDAEEQTWMIGIDETRSQVNVTGEAEPGVLSQGVFVRFEAEVDKRGTARGVLKELTIFTPRGEIGEGLAADGPPREGSPREGPAPEGASLEEGEGRARKVPSVQALVAGRVKSFKNGLLLVNTPDKLVRAKVARDATVTLELADYSFAQIGDAVEASIWRAEPGAGLAETISIELAEKVTGPKKRGAAKKGAKSAGKDKPQAGEEASDEAGEAGEPGEKAAEPDEKAAEPSEDADEDEPRPTRGKPRNKPRAEPAADDE